MSKGTVEYQVEEINRALARLDVLRAMLEDEGKKKLAEIVKNIKATLLFSSNADKEEPITVTPDSTPAPLSFPEHGLAPGEIGYDLTAQASPVPESPVIQGSEVACGEESA
jgi:hypothetical protein